MGNRLTPSPLLGAELLNPWGAEELTDEEKSMVEKNKKDIWTEEKIGPPPSKGRKATNKSKSGSNGTGEQQKLF